MNDRSDIDRVLGYWLEDGPVAMPDRVVDVVARRISLRPQRRSWRLIRRSSMSSGLKYGAAAAAVLVIAIVGYNLLPRFGVGGPAATTPSPAPTASPVSTQAPSPTAAAVRCDDDTSGCLGKLVGGTYSSANFKPRLTYTVPVGPATGPPAAYWTNSLDLSRTYSLVPPGGSYSFGILSEVAIPEQTADCSTKQKAGVGNAVADWVTFLTKHPGLDAQAPVPVTVGGFNGFSVRFARAASWTARCPNSVGPAILTVMHPGHAGVRFTDDQQETFWILDIGGETVLITVDSAPNPSKHTADLASVQPIIESFRFTPPN